MTPTDDEPNYERWKVEGGESPRGEAIFFQVGVVKLLLLGFCSLGLYQIYWSYRNWVLVEERESAGIMPFWRAFFGVFWCYALFSRVDKKARASDFRLDPDALSLSVLWIGLSLATQLPDPYWLIALLNTVPLVFVQNAVFKLNEENGVEDENRSLTTWNLLMVAVGGTYAIFGIWETLFPAELI